jgi:ribonuclease P protein component
LPGAAPKAASVSLLEIRGFAKPVLGSFRSSHQAVQTLKRRADFLRVRGGRRWATPSLVVEAKSRCDTGESGPGAARLGITITRQIGKAVVRNRIRRRLKAAMSELERATRTDFDYVIIARPAAADLRFADLKAELEQALSRVHDPRRRRQSGRPAPAGAPSSRSDSRHG